jgi:hypothetical protein
VKRLSYVTRDPISTIAMHTISMSGVMDTNGIWSRRDLCHTCTSMGIIRESLGTLKTLDELLTDIHMFIDVLEL